MEIFINKIGAKRRKNSGFGTRVIVFFERNRREAPKKNQFFLQGFLKNSRVFSEKKFSRVLLYKGSQKWNDTLVESAYQSVVCSCDSLNLVNNHYAKSTW